MVFASVLKIALMENTITNKENVKTVTNRAKLAKIRTPVSILVKKIRSTIKENVSKNVQKEPLLMTQLTSISLNAKKAKKTADVELASQPVRHVLVHKRSNV